MNLLKWYFIFPIGVLIFRGDISLNAEPLIDSAQGISAPSTVVHQEPRRKDDVAWENDKIAFRVYGPSLKNASEDSGVDLWIITCRLSHC